MHTIAQDPLPIDPKNALSFCWRYTAFTWNWLVGLVQHPHEFSVAGLLHHAQGVTPKHHIVDDMMNALLVNGDVSSEWSADRVIVARAAEFHVRVLVGEPSRLEIGRVGLVVVQ